MISTTRLPLGRSIFTAGLALVMAAPGFAQDRNRDTLPDPPAFAQSRSRVTLPDGTVIPVTLDTALSSRTNRPGDRFTATVRPGYDDAGLPRGTRIEGEVREALPSGGGKPGILDVDFRRVIFPNGQARSLDAASLISLDNKSLSRSSDGRIVASANTSKDRAKFIGIGAGAGLLIATVAKQNTLASLLLGAGAGYLYNELQGKKPGDVNLKVGTEFGVRMDRQFAFDSDLAPARVGLSPPDASDRYYHRGDLATPAPFDRTNREIGDIGVMIDDRNVDFGSLHPVMRGPNVLIPLKAAAKTGRFDYTYDPETEMVRARGGSLKLALGSRIAIFNGERRRMDAAPEMRNGTMFVPMQFVALAVGGSAYWDAASRTVVITTRDRERL